MRKTFALTLSILLALVLSQAQAQRVDSYELRSWILREKREQNPLLFDTITRSALELWNANSGPLQNWGPQDLAIVRDKISGLLSLQYQARYGKAPPFDSNIIDMLSQIPVVGPFFGIPSKALEYSELEVEETRRSAAEKLRKLEDEVLFKTPEEAIGSAYSLLSNSQEWGMLDTLLDPYRVPVFGFDVTDSDTDLRARHPTATRLYDNAETLGRLKEKSDALSQEIETTKITLRELSDRIDSGKATANDYSQFADTLRKQDAAKTLQSEVTQSTKDTISNSLLYMFEEKKEMARNAAILRAWTPGLSLLLAPHDPVTQQLISETLGIVTILFETPSAWVAGGALVSSATRLLLIIAGSNKVTLEKRLYEYFQTTLQAIRILKSDIALLDLRVGVRLVDLDAKLSDMTLRLNDITILLVEQNRSINELAKSVIDGRVETAIYNNAAWVGEYDNLTAELERLEEDCTTFGKNKLGDDDCERRASQFARFRSTNGNLTGRDLLLSIPNLYTVPRLIQQVLNVRGEENAWAIMNSLIQNLSKEGSPHLPGIPNPNFFFRAANIAISSHNRSKTPDMNTTVLGEADLRAHAATLIELCDFWRQPKVTKALINAVDRSFSELLMTLEQSLKPEFIGRMEKPHVLANLLDDYYPWTQAVATETPIHQFVEPESSDLPVWPVMFLVPKDFETFLVPPAEFANNIVYPDATEIGGGADAMVSLTGLKRMKIESDDKRTMDWAESYANEAAGAIFSKYQDWGGEPFLIPSAVLRVNRVIEALYGLSLYEGGSRSSNSGPSVFVTVKPEVFGVYIKPIRDKGGCSDIPLHEEIRVMLRYDLKIIDRTLEANKQISMKEYSEALIPILRVWISDYQGLMVGKRCWRGGKPGERYHERNIALGFEIARRIKIDLPERLRALVNTDVFQTAVVSLQEGRNSAGFLELSGKALEAEINGPSGDIHVKWRFGPPENASSALAKFEQIGVDFRRAFWNFSAEALVNPGKDPLLAAARLDLSIRTFIFTLRTALGSQMIQDPDIQRVLSIGTVSLQDSTDILLAILEESQRGGGVRSVINSLATRNKKSTRSLVERTLLPLWRESEGAVCVAARQLLQRLEEE